MKIIKCKVMSTIIAMEREDETEIIDGTKDMMEFTQLRSLTLDDLPNLKCFHSNVDSHLLFNEKVSFKNLTTLIVRSCGSLKYLLSSSTARSLVQLKDLGIYKCEFIEEILATESSEEKRTDNILFPKLESLDLEDLPTLMRFSFENLIEFPFLKALKITDCPELKTFVSNSLSTNLTVNKELEEMNNCATHSLFNEKVSFKSLTTLTVRSCGSLKYLLSSSTARSLVQLKDLKIYKCEVMEEILATESSEEKRTNNILFPKRGEAGDDEILFNQLESLLLSSLLSLTSFSLGNCNIKFPSLKNVIVVGCPKLKIFSHGLLSTPKLQRVDLIKIFREYWGQADVVVTPTEKLGEVDLNATVERFWEDNFNKTEEQSFTIQKDETSRDDKEHDMDNESKLEYCVQGETSRDDKEHDMDNESKLEYRVQGETSRDDKEHDMDNESKLEYRVQGETSRDDKEHDIDIKSDSEDHSECSESDEEL